MLNLITVQQLQQALLQQQEQLLLQQQGQLLQQLEQPLQLQVQLQQQEQLLQLQVLLQQEQLLPFDRKQSKQEPEVQLTERNVSFLYPLISCVKKFGLAQRKVYLIKSEDCRQHHFPSARILAVLQ